jgi:hypothetical protein
MPSTEEYLATYADAMRPHCPEQIVAVGAVKAPGAMTDLMRTEVAGKYGRFVAGWLGRSVARAAVSPPPSDEPTDLLLAVSASAVRAFTYKTKTGTKVTITGEHARWPREGLEVTVDPPGRLTQRLHLRWPNGAEVELDAVLPPGRYKGLNDTLLSTLGAVAAR